MNSHARDSILRFGITKNEIETLVNVKRIIPVAIKAAFCFGFGFFYILLIMLAMMSLPTDPGPKDGELMLGAMIGITTFPVAIVAAWFLYKYKMCRWVIYASGAVGLAFFLLTAGLMAFDLLTRPPGFHGL